MAKRSDILNRLREYEVTPPPAVFQNLLKRLEAEAALGDDSQWLGAWQGLQHLEVPPPAFLQAAVAEAARQPMLAALQEVSVPPPPGAFAGILKQVEAANPQKQNKPAPVKKLFTPYQAVAAVLLLVLAGWGIYRLTGRQETHPATMAGQTAPVNKTPAVDTTQQQPTSKQADVASYHAYDNPKTENYFKNNRFTVEGEGLSLVENDFFVTFASYRYEELPAFLAEEEDSEFMIRLDQYSYFTLSEAMVNTLKKMYQRRGKGTPTRRARKEKAKLEEWKKADEKYFDYSRSHNPLDPMDLAEFIFK